MAPSKLKKAIDAVKDQTSIGLARVNTSTSISDIEVAIVKATRHEEYPADERHIRELLSLTSYSLANVGACIKTLSRRLNKTKNWVVALKTLMLIQRLISDGDPSYEQEIFFATRRGTRFLNMSDFRDTSRSSSGWDYSAFVRTFALYMDEQLEFRMQGKRGKRVAFASYEEEEREEERWEEERGGGRYSVGREKKPPKVVGTPVQDLRSERLFSRLQHLMQLLERFLACRPTGLAKQNRLVMVALYPIVKESFTIYYDLIEVQHILMDRFIGLEVADCAKAYEIFCRMAKQFDELDSFYGWSKSAAIARSTEYPEVDQVPQKSLELMDEFIREKSGTTLQRKASGIEIKKEEKNEAETKTDVVEEDMNAIKALPPPEGWEEEKKEDEVVEPPAEPAVVYKEADLLDMSDDVATRVAHGDQLALALFDGAGGASGVGTSTQPWEAFKDTVNWETALVQSTTNLPNQKTSFPGGFDTMLLDSMYQRGATIQSANHSGYMATGSASSVAIGSAGQPAMLALPAPPLASGMAASATGVDPFYASVPVPPPSYVQMTEMEKKQMLLVQEQMMWQQYRMDGMQGQGGYNHHMQQNPYPYHMGGYRHT